jgi:hypothetical protein
MSGGAGVTVPAFVTAPTLELRLRACISVAWQAFARKTGHGNIAINKEASMQLQYAYILKHLVSLALHAPDEKADIELETGIRTPQGWNNVDILLRGSSAAGPITLAIELKCYRNLTASGGARGAHDIFMKDVYEDLHILEEYTSSGAATRGIALVMTDLRRFVEPVRRGGNCWAYDIAHGTVFNGGRIQVPIGGKSVDVRLNKKYAFQWSQVGAFWFLELEGS